MAENATNINAAGTHVIIPATDPESAVTSMPRNVLHGVLVGTGVASGTATVRYADDEVIAVIAADNPDIGRNFFDLAIGGRGLEVVTVEDIDVTVFWS